MAMSEYQKKYYSSPEGKQKKRSYNFKYNQLLRLEVYRHYSKQVEPSCACCGEKEPRFMTLDHINGGGKAHRKKLGNGNTLYRNLRKLGYPKGLRVLCMNCNHAIGHYGRCPHEMV